MKKRVKALVLGLFLAGCHSQISTSPEKLTEKYVSRMEKTHADIKINRAYLISEAKGPIRGAWEAGQEDRKTGMNEEYVRERIDYFKNIRKNLLKNVQVNEDVTFELINFYATMAPEMVEAYQAGYNSKL